VSRDSLNAGLSNRFVDGTGFIHGPAWNRAGEGLQVVGTCRQRGCPGLLLAQPTHQENNRTWYGAECNECGHEVVAPDGRTLPRSSRRDEMPGGAWDRREELLKKLKEAAKSDSD